MNSTARLLIYVSLSMVSAATAGIVAVDFNNPVQTAVFTLAIVAAGLTTAKSFLETPPSAK